MFDFSPLPASVNPSFGFVPLANSNVEFQFPRDGRMTTFANIVDRKNLDRFLRLSFSLQKSSYWWKEVERNASLIGQFKRKRAFSRAFLFLPWLRILIENYI